MRHLMVACGFVIGLVSLASADERLTQADLLYRLIDLDRLTTPPPVGETTGMFSSYDRASQIDANGKLVDWDANGDWGKFIRAEADGWQVMAEMNGPGAITRIWSANPHGQIRFYLDGELVIETPFEDLFNGNLAPFAEPLCYANPNNGGKNCYFPIGYNESCKVTIKGSKSYYQINHVAFAPDTRVTRFNFDLDDRAQAVLADVAAAFSTGLTDVQLFGGRSTTPIAAQEDLGRDTSLVQELEGAGTIRALYVSLTDRGRPRHPYALHNCVLRVFFDDQERPSVEAPLVDFFGSGFTLRTFNSLPIGTDKWIMMGGGHVKENRFMYCYFPMPFKRGARIEIENRGSDRRAIGVMLYLEVEHEPPAPDALRFHARFRKEDPCQVLDYPILEATGRGRFVGCTLNIDCPRRAWWGEGDDKVWIDRDGFPSYFGTGSEDYLGDAWGLRPHIRALQGVSLKNPYGKNSAYRWHIADCINFQEYIYFTIENWQHGRQWDTYYGTVAYWYGAPDGKDFFEPLTPEDLTPPGLRIPDSSEVEGNVLGEGWGNVVKQKYARGAELSGQQGVIISSEEPVQIKIPASERRVVRLQLRVNPRVPFETIEVTGAGERAVGSVAYARIESGIHDVGTLRLNAGDNEVTVHCKGSPVLDCWIMQPVPKIRGGFEAEDLQVTSADGVTATIEDVTHNWSGGSQLVLDFEGEGKTAALALPEREEASAQVISLQITRSPEGGRYQALLDDQPLGSPFDAYAEKPAIERVWLGSANLTEGKHTLAFRAVDADARSTGRKLGLDAIILAAARSPHAVECEGLTIVGFDQTNHLLQHMPGGYSGGAQLFARPSEPGAWLEFEVPVEKAGKYKLAIVYTTSFDYGIVQTYVNGKKAGEPFDTFGNLQPGPVRQLGTYDLPADPLRIKCELIGKAEKSPGYYFGADCIILERE